MKLNNRAFSITELLTALGISAILCTGVYGTYITAQQFYARTISEQGLQRDAAILMDTIIKGKTPMPGTIYRLSEGSSFYQLSPSEIRFVGVDGKCRGWRLSADGASVIHYLIDPSSIYPSCLFYASLGCLACGNEQDDVIVYTAPQGAALGLRFWQLASATSVGIDVGISRQTAGRTVSGSVSTIVNMRNHSTTS